MRNYLKNLAFTMVALFIVVSFIRFDLNVVDWSTGGRGLFLFFSIFIAVFASIAQEDINK
jgi:hypothetical protein